MSGYPKITKWLRTSRGSIDYSIYDFIKEMEKKPVIWNRMHIDSKNTAIVEKNWRYFAATIVPFIDELPEDEQTLIIDEFKTRWYNIRKKLRTHILAIKKGTSEPCYFLILMEFFLNSKKQYLKNIISEEEIEKLKEEEINWKAKAGMTNAEIPNEEKLSKKRTRPVDEIETSNNKRSARLKQKQIDKTEKINQTQTITKKPKMLQIKKIESINQLQTLTEKPKHTEQSPGNISFDPMSLCETTSQDSFDDVSMQNTQFDCQEKQHGTNLYNQNYAANDSVLDLRDKTYDAHQAFFDSIKPTLRRLNDFQKLDFKIEVLKTLKKYKLY